MPAHYQTTPLAMTTPAPRARACHVGPSGPRGAAGMTAVPIADDVRRFVLFAIPSVPFLEALLLMRSMPNQGWDAALLARRLYLGERTAADLLAELGEAGIAAPAQDGYAYCPQDEQLADLLDRLAAAYSHHLVEITHLIHSKADGKQQQFANAFLLRRQH